jgi:hypothetical protein
MSAPENPTPETAEPTDTNPTADQMQHQLEAQQELLATAEAQRDELQMRLTQTENRHAIEAALAAAGTTDVDLAMAALRGRVDLDEPLERDTITQAVEKLLLDKPLLAGLPAGASMPPATSGPRDEPTAGTARLTQAARQAATTGNRKDIAEYLRLRRQAARQ